MTKTYDTIIDLLNHEGPGLQDYVTPEQLQQLIDGTLPAADIADNYQVDLDDSSLVAVATDDTTTRADLLTWIRWEIEGAIEQRKQTARDDAMCAKLNELAALTAAEARFTAAIHTDKVTLARQALDRGATKSSVAQVAQISRPTLDKWLAEK